MGKMKYKKPEAPEIRGLCVKCGNNPQKGKPGGKFRSLCSNCDKKLYEKNYKERSRLQAKKYKTPYKKYKTTVCNKCGFTSEYSCQFDIDHIDGNHSNNNLINLQTLCSNCHRLKTYLNQDWIKRKPQRTES